MKYRTAVAALFLAGSSWTSPAVPESDRRGMQELRTARAGLPEVLSLRPVSFVSRGRGDRRFGLVAQDVQALLPEVVSGEGEMLSVRYGELVPVLIRAIQEQQTLIELQADRLRRLESQLDEDQP